MTNYPFEDVSQLRDVESLNLLKQNTGNEEWAWHGIKTKGRDNARTPMQWDATANGGFSTDTPWIAVNPNYTSINAETAEKDGNSVLHFYRELIALRNSSDELRYGTFRLLYPEHPQLFAYERVYGNGNVTVLCNVSREPCHTPEVRGEVMLANCEYSEELAPFAAVVIKKE